MFIFPIAGVKYAINTKGAATKLVNTMSMIVRAILFMSFTASRTAASHNDQPIPGPSCLKRIPRLSSIVHLHDNRDWDRPCRWSHRHLG